MSQGVYVLGGKCPLGKCPGGICPWGNCRGGTCLGGLCPRTSHGGVGMGGLSNQSIGYERVFLLTRAIYLARFLYFLWRSASSVVEHSSANPKVPGSILGLPHTSVMAYDEACIMHFTLGVVHNFPKDMGE